MAQATTNTEALEKVWEPPRNAAGVIGDVDHKKIGLRYIYTAFAFFLVGGVEAALMRTQLIRPENTFLSPEAYNQLMTMHGTTMIFLFATPILFGFGNYLVPLMIGARDMAFPRLNAFGYWVFVLGGLLMYSSFVFGTVPDGGWTAYTPLTDATYSPGTDLDFWTVGLLFLGIATTGGAINFIVTIFRMRAPGMSVGRMPIFVWTILVTSFSVVFAIPCLNAANLMLLLQRQLGFHFFDPAFGGDPLLWQHMFWLFGHPDVYIIVLPALGMISEIIPTFSRRPIIGYPIIVTASVATGIIGAGVWAHHMFATGIPALALSFFSASSFLITIPSGVQVFAWLFTIMRGRPTPATPMLFAAGFIITFVIGGLTGVMFPLIALDRQVTDSYFVVAHFHYTLFGGMVFPLFAAMYFWLPKMSGRMLDETAGRWNFWLMFIGFNLTFLPMHATGLFGMPRRVYTYEANLGWNGLNLVSTIGAYLIGISILVFIVNVIASLARGRLAGNNPWAAPTLEWATTSPPEPYNFLRIPYVTSANPLWEREDVVDPNVVPDAPFARADDPTDPFARETPLSTPLEGLYQDPLAMPAPSTTPFWLALALTLLSAAVIAAQGWLALAAAILAFIALVWWLWPSREVAA